MARRILATVNFAHGRVKPSVALKVFSYQGRTLDLSKPFARLTMAEAVCQYHPQYTPEQLADAHWLRERLKAMKVDVKPNMGLGTLQLMMFEEITEANLWEPTFIIDYPAEISPLARANDDDRDITERFELFLVGREIARRFYEEVPLGCALSEAAGFAKKHTP